MAQQSKYRARLRVRFRISLTSDDLRLLAIVGGREIQIKSQTKEEKLREAKWLVFSAGGFDTEEEARQFGEQLRTIASIVGVCARLGIDVGNDLATSSINEDFARSMGLIQPQERVHPNVHGLMVIPDDGLSRIPIMNAKGTVTSDPTQLVQGLEELGNSLPRMTSIAQASVRILNLALMSTEPLTQVVLAISVVESLGQDENWSEHQKSLLVRLASEVESQANAGVEEQEIADAIRRSLYRMGLRQGVLRVLARLNLMELRKEWDRLYRIRSGVFHGTLQLSDSETHQLAQDAITLCGQIVIAVLGQEGIVVPSISEKHFPKIGSKD